MAILFDSIEMSIQKVMKDDCGNLIIAYITIKGIRLTFATINGPNSDLPKFYHDIFNAIDGHDNESIIICGDWNLILDQSLDLESYKNINNPKARKTVLDYLSQFNLIGVNRMEMLENLHGGNINPESKLG